MRDGWVETTFGDVFKIVAGKYVAKEEYVEGGEFWIYGSNSIMGKLDRFLVQQSHVIMAAIGAYAGAVRYSKEPSWINNNAMALVPSEKVMAKYLYLWLESMFDLKRVVVGTGQPYVQRPLLLKEIIELPPLLEQKRIVDLISSVDSYVEALQQQLESAKRSRNAVLHELLTVGGDDWVETTLGEAAEVIMGRQLSPSKKLGTRPRPYIRAANIGSWGINLEDIYEMDFTEIEEERFACQVGDTILVEGGNEKSVGCPSLITEKESGLCIQNTVIRSRSRNSKALDPNFQYHLLRFMFWRGDFAQLCAGTTIMHLGQKRAEVVPISIPPLGEQLNIVDTISKFDSAVTYSEETLISAKSLRSGLLSELLSGEHLIPSSYDKVIGAA